MVNKMKENNELLMHIYKVSEMGVLSTSKLLNTLKNKENKIKTILSEELKKYEEFYKITNKLLNKEKVVPKGSSIITKISSDMGITMETIKDNSDAAIAKMLIEGFTMGNSEMTMKVNKYKDICNKKIIKIANELIKFQGREIDKLKTYM